MLIDLASDAAGFATLAALVRGGGTAVTTGYVADPEALAAADVHRINFQVAMSAELLQRVTDGVAGGRLTPPPITTVKLGDLPAVWQRGQPGVKTVVVPSAGSDELIREDDR